MEHIGIDIHKRESQICILTPDGEMIEAWRKHGIEPGKMPVARYRKCLTTGTCKYCPFGSVYRW